MLLTFSQLPNEYIISFIPKNTNKTQKRSHFLGEIAIAIEIGAISIGEIAIAISLISIARSLDQHFVRDRRDRDRNLADFDHKIAIGVIAIARSVDREIAIDALHEISKIAIAISPISIARSREASIAIAIEVSCVRDRDQRRSARCLDRSLSLSLRLVVCFRCFG